MPIESGKWYNKGFIKGNTCIEEVFENFRTSCLVETQIDELCDDSKSRFLEGFLDAMATRLEDLFPSLGIDNRSITVIYKDNEDYDDDDDDDDDDDILFK
jgi:hypothetical protein